MIKFSIVTAVYNRKKTISESIDSLYNQIYPKKLIEHIIIDGCSTDGTLEILRSKIMPNTLLISEKDDGVYYALNKGFKIATGDVIGVMHSDDFYSDNEILKEVSLKFNDPKVDIVYGDLDYVSSNDPGNILRHWKTGEFNYKKLKLGWMPPHPSFFIRRSVVERIGYFNTSYKISADYDAMVRYLTDTNLRIEYIEKVLVKMRVGGISNSTITKVLIKMREDFYIIKNNKIGGVYTLIFKNLFKIKQFFYRFL